MVDLANTSFAISFASEGANFAESDSVCIRHSDKSLSDAVFHRIGGVQLHRCSSCSLTFSEYDAIFAIFYNETELNNDDDVEHNIKRRPNL